MEFKTDSSGQVYVDVDNVRLTFIPSESRPPEKNWADKKYYVRFNAYKGKGDSLHPGAELPMNGIDDARKFLEALIELVRYQQQIDEMK